MEWSESLCTGIELLDQQHRSLLDCVEALKRTGGRSGLLKSAYLMDALRLYVTVHFSTEENLMRQGNYPDLEAHIAEHREFVVRLDGLMQENMRHDNTAQLVGFLEHWLENHLLRSDMQYVPYLKDAVR